MHHPVLAMLLLAGCTGCVHLEAPPADSHTASSDAAVRFLAIGDMGSGSADQYRVAAAMTAVCSEHGCDFVVGLGDNIYPRGVSSPYDSLFEDRFELPYRQLDVPFYMTLGNHDDGGAKGLDQAAGLHQVAYAQRDDRSTQKWIMPARYYDFTVGDVQFYALDTPSLMDHRPLDDPVHGAQREWLQQAVAHSDASWKIAFGHHPYVSNSRWGNAGDYEDQIGAGIGVQQLIEAGVCHQVDLYLSGHAHSLQWLQATPSCGDTQFIISGAGGRSARSIGDTGNPTYFAQGQTFGFFWIEIDGDLLTAKAYDSQARPLHVGTIELTRT